MSPHLFTHLFHEGVIISTRKLVYDSSSSEEAIKSLMQSQHKAVLRDLKIHTFDDKIDVYLANVEGLEPRAGVPVPAAALRVSDPEITIEPGEPLEIGERASTDPGEPPIEQIDLRPPTVAQPLTAAVPRAKHESTVPPLNDAPKPRTKTADRTSKGSQFRSMAPSDPDAAPTEDVHTAATVPVSQPAGAQASAASQSAGLRPPAQRSATPPPIPPRTATSASRVGIPIMASTDSSPEIEIITAQEAGESGRLRAPRDTAVDNPYEDGIPSGVGPDLAPPSDGIPMRPAAEQPSTRMADPSRQPSVGAATLPAVRQPSRPAIATPSVVLRPLPESQRDRGDSEAAEIYAPAPASADSPPGERSERPGQYSMNRRRDISSQENAPLRELTARVAVPAGLARPRPPQPPAQPPSSAQSGAIRTGAPSTPPIPSVPQQARGQQVSDGAPRAPTQGGPTQAGGTALPAPLPPPPPAPVQAAPIPIAHDAASDGVPQPEGRAQTPTRMPHLTAPISSRTVTGSGGPNSSGNVVMSRPAVIVGAPAKPPGSPAPKVRKAREDEGRGFGQGLISEKSLDEVILAYLSEDADEK